MAGAALGLHDEQLMAGSHHPAISSSLNVQHGPGVVCPRRIWTSLGRVVTIQSREGQGDGFSLWRRLGGPAKLCTELTNDIWPVLRKPWDQELAFGSIRPPIWDGKDQVMLHVSPRCLLGMG